MLFFIYRVGYSQFQFFVLIGVDFKICIWNVGIGEFYVEINFLDFIYLVSFSYNGNRFVCICKDKIFRVIDLRIGKVIKVIIKCR